MPRILVMGELNADLILSGLQSMPILGREILGQDFKMALGSSSAITAARLSALGAEVDFIGIVGKDEIGQFVMTQLENAGVNCHLVKKVDIPTGVTISLTYSDDRALLTYPGTIAAYDGEGISLELLADYSHIHVGAFFLQSNLQAQLSGIFKMAQDANLTTSLDVGWDPHEKWMENPHLAKTLNEVDFFFPNEDETEALVTGDITRPEGLSELVKGTLIVKQGANGATAYQNGQSLIHVDAFPASVVDTTGAGDAFNAGFIYANCIENLELADALRFASACGAQAVTQIGGASNAPSAQEIKKHYLEASK